MQKITLDIEQQSYFPSYNRQRCVFYVGSHKPVKMFAMPPEFWQQIQKIMIYFYNTNISMTSTNDNYE